MASPERLADAQINDALMSLQEWSYTNNAIEKTYAFDTYLRGVEFVNAVAHLAERQDHHPDIDVRYRKVLVRYWTHGANGVTQKDLDGAKEAEGIFAQFKKLVAVPNGG